MMIMMILSHVFINKFSIFKALITFFLNKNSKLTIWLFTFYFYKFLSSFNYKIDHINLFELKKKVQINAAKTI